MDTGADTPDLDAIYELLADSRRRCVLYYLLDSNHRNVEGLARRIAAREQDVATESVSSDETDSVTLSLVHNHLPKLADHGIITYDRRNQDVVVGANFEAIRPTIERAREFEGDGPVISNASESFSYNN